MTDAVTNMALGAVAGGGFQLVSEVMKVFQMLAQNTIEQTKALNAERRLNAKVDSENADAANKRGGAGLRWALALIIIPVAFLGLWMAGWLEIDTTVLTEKEPWFNFFNIIKFGKALEVTVAHGFVLPPYFGESVQVIIGFVFGVTAARTGKRI